MKKYNYTIQEMKIWGTLRTPAKIQDFLDALPFNFEEHRETCMSPRAVLRTGTAHCMEGALFAAAMLEFHGQKPLILDLRSITRPYDFDHVVAVYKKFGCWGAISKTNHAVLRFREPIYKTPRELALSYFHEYFLNSTGQKTLREYSVPFDLTRFDDMEWRTSEEQLFEIPECLDQSRHYPIISPAQIKNLRLADLVEIKAGEIVEYERKGKTKTGK